MYVIVTTNKRIAEEARIIGANVIEISEGENSSKSEILTDKDLEAKIMRVMHAFAFKPNLKGYDYIKYVLLCCATDKEYHRQSITRVIYPSIAKKHESTNSRVERAFRHSLQRSFEEVPEQYDNLFGRTLTRMPTNSEFISMMSEYLARINI